MEHPNLAIVMELMNGNLSTLLATQQLQWGLKIRIALEISEGLNVLHNHKVSADHRISY